MVMDLDASDPFDPNELKQVVVFEEGELACRTVHLQAGHYAGAVYVPDRIDVGEEDVPSHGHLERRPREDGEWWVWEVDEAGDACVAGGLVEDTGRPILMTFSGHDVLHELPVDSTREAVEEYGERGGEEPTVWTMQLAEEETEELARRLAQRLVGQE